MLLLLLMCLVIDEKFKVDKSLAFLAFVNDALEPCPALDVQKLSAGNVRELDSDGWAHQVGLDLQEKINKLKI